tara:strand:+ start:1095 stop:1568 length:474 start_codon:yes stop_codon:yes gene_type:complete
MKKCEEQEFLNKAKTFRKIMHYNNRMIKRDIPDLVNYIPMEDYIIFLSKIPLKLWAKKPIMYYNNMTWDALGFLGERIHHSTARTKYLQLCFRKAGLDILEIIDDEHDDFKKFKNNKERFLAALHYVEEKLKLERIKDLVDLYKKSKTLADQVYYYE